MSLRNRRFLTVEATPARNGNVCNAAGRLLCKVQFYGSEVRDAAGRLIGSVGLAGAPEPMPDMQWRGAAALLLLCAGLDQPNLDDMNPRVQPAHDIINNLGPARVDGLIEAPRLPDRGVQKAAALFLSLHEFHLQVIDTAVLELSGWETGITANSAKEI